jgi:hypothetical protein
VQRETGIAICRIIVGRANPPQVGITLLFLFLWVAGFALRSLVVSGITLIFAFWIVVGHLPVWKKMKGAEKVTIVAFLLLMIAILPVSAARGETAVMHFAVVLLSLGSAYVLTTNAAIYYQASRWLLISVLAITFCYLSVNGVEWDVLEYMLPSSSSNGITSYLVVLQVNYCVAHYMVKRQPVLITPLLTVVICIVGYGRGSILAGAAILLLNVLALFSPWHDKQRVFAAAFVVIGSLLAVSSYSEEISNFIESNTKIGSGLHDSTRQQQIEEYISKMGPVSVITGADYRGTSIEADYNNNPHNSYIRGHHIFGLPYLIAMLTFPLLFVSARDSFGQKVYILGLLIVMLFRAFTEPILFPTMLDFFYFAVCFSLKHKGVNPGACRPGASNQ